MTDKEKEVKRLIKSIRKKRKELEVMKADLLEGGDFSEEEREVIAELADLVDILSLQMGDRQ
jgi:hypothetical protein